jgi:amino acid adenylation domain-containing protein
MLLHGGKLVLSSKEVLLDESRLAGLMQQHGVDMMWFTAGWLNELVDKDITLFRGLKTLLAGGDKLSPVHINRLLQHYPSLRIINGYGPTENTTFSLTYPVSVISDSIPIGTPISNSTAYVLDAQQQLCPIGVTGEICVGGDGLARGYLNQPDLTAEKFVTHPFEENARIYKTGDLGRWLPDGNIAFIGRKDEQVKIRGYRIELGEIESQLQQHEDIDATVVIAGGDQELVAYIVSKATLNVAELRAYLGKTLPDYMIPGHYVQLEKLPLNDNGKVDRKQLPDREGFGMETGVAYVQARNETEKQLVLIWQEILGKERIGVKDDFFDLGGHSLKAARLASQIHKIFDVKVELKDLFTYTILEAQATIIATAGKNTFVNIPCAAPQDGYVLSSSQRRLWVLSQFGEGSLAYHVPGVYIFEGTLDIAKLQDAFAALIARHESLRTIFKEDKDGEIRQFIRSSETSLFTVAFHDLRFENEAIKEQVQSFAAIPFDLKNGPLLKAGLWQMADDKWVFMYVLHHIISDGWSMNILIKELLHYYNSEPDQLPSLRIQYKDYAVWQQEQLNGELLAAHKEYWLSQFAGELPVLELPADKVRPAVKTYNGRMLHHSINAETSKGIKAFTQEQGGTLFMGLLAAVNALLYRYTGQEDIIIGTAVAGREHADLEDQIGFYVNTLALRTRFNGADTYTDLLSKVKEVTLDAYKYQAYPFDELVDQLDLDRDLSRNALFDVMVVLQNNEMVDTVYPGGLKVSGYEEEVETSKLDLIFTFFESGEEIHASIQYNSDIYLAATIERLAGHLLQLLDILAIHPALPVQQLNYLSTREMQQLTTGFNGTVADYNKEHSVVEMFEAQVLKTPAAIAVEFEFTLLTYKDLNEQANQLAHYLRKRHKVRPDDLVGIQLERSEWLIIAMLAVLKAGGAYVPIDPEYPQSRIDHMITDSHCKVLINATELEQFRSEQPAFNHENPEKITHAGNLAYIIYTSGSTGMPKGVLVTHGNLRHFLFNISHHYHFSVPPVQPFIASASFDISLFQLFMPLLSGGRSIMTVKEEVQDIRQFTALVKRSTAIDTVPGVYTLLVTYIIENNLQGSFSHIEKIFIGGDAIADNLLHTLAEIFSAADIIVTYGPTEGTVFCTHLIYKPGMITTVVKGAVIGAPMNNNSIYIVDERQQLLPVGLTGEICITGGGLSAGYLNQPDLTAAKFVTNPFVPGERMYKTGDLGRWQADGTIVFCGRKDDQVKISGFRIELGEIEAALRLHEEIDNAVVIVRHNGGEKELVAYIVSRATLHIPDLRAYLSNKLPAYMVPGYFVQLEEIPLTTNGKVDRKRLPDPGNTLTGVEYVAPRNETEMKLAQIWEEILGREKIGVKDDFFDLGGQSLKATRVIMRVKKEFNIEIDLSSIFLEPTIEVLADKIMTDMWLQTSLVEEDDNSFDEIKI